MTEQRRNALTGPDLSDWLSPEDAVYDTFVPERGGMTGDPAEPRELAGRLVRQVWLEWAREQPSPKPSWLLLWEQLDEGQREVDMRIGDALFERGRQAGLAQAERNAGRPR